MIIWLYTILIVTALYFLGSRTVITQPLWSRYPKGFARFMDCPMCAPTWYGLLVSLVAIGLGYDYPGLSNWHAPFVVALSSMVVTPLTAATVEICVERVGSAAHTIEPLEDDEP